MKLFLSLSFLAFSFSGFSAHADVVEFHIAASTGANPWNTQATVITAKVGDTIRFINNDSATHRLHTFGAPCNHGPDFGPGSTFDCVTTSPYSAAADGPLYDHNFGESAQVWLEVK